MAMATTNESTIDWEHALWAKNGVTVAGGNKSGDGLNQLSYPSGMYLDEDSQCIYIADNCNHRIVEWKMGEKSGQVVAGGNGRGNHCDQLNRPTDVIVDKQTDSLIICDWKNQRVMRWPRRNGTSGETIIENINCFGLTMDDQRFLYVSGEDTVTRYRMGETNGTIVAGGNGNGNRLNQLHWATYVFVDRDYSVYVSDCRNDRVMKWMKGSQEGIVVAGGMKEDFRDVVRSNSWKGLSVLFWPRGLFVDPFGTIYVVATKNNRVMRWRNRASQGIIIAGGNGWGYEANQLDGPEGLSFDRQGNLYIVDYRNHRIQRFSIEY